MRSSRGLPAARCSARASLRPLGLRFQSVRLENIARGSARDVPAVVNESENTGKERQSGKQKDQDTVAKRLRALGAGGGSVLVAHGASLGCCGRREGQQERDKTEN